MFGEDFPTGQEIHKRNLQDCAQRMSDLGQVDSGCLSFSQEFVYNTLVERIRPKLKIKVLPSSDHGLPSRRI